MKNKFIKKPIKIKDVVQVHKKLYINDLVAWVISINIFIFLHFLMKSKKENPIIYLLEINSNAY